MQGFLDRHQRDVVGVLSGFDRILFRGTLRSISYLGGMDKFLGAQQVLDKHFGRFAEGISQKLKEHAHQFAVHHPSGSVRWVELLRLPPLSGGLRLRCVGTRARLGNADSPLSHRRSP